MFSKEMEALIEATLADGILEEHEKAALRKRAQKEGIDLDELEIYIQSLLQKRTQNQMVQIAKETATHEKLRIGNVCPHCAVPVPPLTKICPNCGRAINANETSGDKELFNLIDSISAASVKVKSSLTIEDFKQAKAECEALLKKASVFYGENKKVQMLVFDLKEEISKAESKVTKQARTESILKNRFTIILFISVLVCIATLIAINFFSRGTIAWHILDTCSLLSFFSSIIFGAIVIIKHLFKKLFNFSIF